MRRTRRVGVVVLALAALLGTPARATSGKVVDAEGKSVQDAKVCYVVGGVNEDFCVRTGVDGRYVLPSSALPSIRVLAKGYFPRSAPSGDLAEPLVVAKACAVRVKLTRADGAAVPAGEVWVALPWGEERGPFPARAAGVEVGSLPPIGVIVVARAEGLVETHSPVVPLSPGEAREIVLSLPSRPAPAPAGTP